MSYEPREFLRHILAESEFLVEASAGLTRLRLDGANGRVWVAVGRP